MFRYSQKLLGKRCLRVALGLVVAIFSSHGYANVCDLDSNLSQAVVQIEQDGKYSTGVVVDQDRLLTVAHAIDWQKQSSEIVANIDGRYSTAKPLLIYENTDLALLDVSTGSVRPLQLSAKDPLVSEMIWVSGFPEGRARTIESGLVSDIQQKSIVTSAKVFPGVSGGGLFRCDVGSGRYQLAGIVTSYLARVDGEKISNTGKSVSLRLGYIRDLMHASSLQLIRNSDNIEVPSVLAARPLH